MSDGTSSAGREIVVVGGGIGGVGAGVGLARAGGPVGGPSLIYISAPPRPA